MRRARPIDNLRAEVRKRRGQVTAKENRIKRNTGVDIRGTVADPRRPVNEVERLNFPALKKYKRELDAFMSRSSGFVAGVNNAPIPKTEWLEYKRLERQYNQISANQFDSIKGIKLPKGLGNMTIAEREIRMVPDDKRSQGEVMHRPYAPLDRKPSRIKDAAALAKLKAALQKKMNTDYLPSQIAAARSQLAGMLTGAGHGQELLEEANKLSDSQFNVLWNYTNFATAVSAVHESEKRAAKRIAKYEEIMGKAATIGAKDNRGMAGVVEGFSSDIREFFGWAKSLPETGTERIAPGGNKKTAPAQKATRKRR